MSMLLSESPRRRSIDNSVSFTDNASSWCFAADKPFPSTVIEAPRIQSVSKLGNVREVQRANTLSQEQLESAFPSKDSARTTGQPHIKKVMSLTSSQLDKSAYKEKNNEGGWFS